MNEELPVGRRAVALLVLVSGSDLDDVSPEFVRGHLDSLHKAATYLGVRWSILHGAAPGVDTIAGEWAAEHGIEVRSIEADWSRWGGLAGEARNHKLLQVALKAEAANWGVLVLGFPSKRSKGTWHMLKLAREHGLRNEVCFEDRTEERTA